MVDVRGDVLRPPHGTTPAAVKSNKNQKWDPLRAMKTFIRRNSAGLFRGEFFTPGDQLLLKFDFLLKYEAYSIKWTSDTWCFAGLYLSCGSFQRLRWSTAVWCRLRNRKTVHVIRKILWKTESVMIGKIVTFWRVKMQIWVIFGILLVNECCGTLGTTVNEAYFALFSMGAHVTGMTSGCEILISTFQLIQPFGSIFSILLSKRSQYKHFPIHEMHIRQDFLDFWHQKHFKMAFSWK